MVDVKLLNCCLSRISFLYVMVMNLVWIKERFLEFKIVKNNIKKLFFDYFLMFFDYLIN